MERREFLKTAAAMSALAGSGLSHAAPSPWANGVEWKPFELTTRVDIARSAGETRVWVPLPLSSDTDYARTLNSAWNGNASSARLVRDAQGNAMLVAEWSRPTENAFVEVSSRVALRDRAVDLSRAGRAAAEDVGEYLKSSQFIPTDGIVKATAQKAVKGAKGDVAKARAIYDWIVENCRREGSVRGCGTGDVRAMLESGNLAGKCADLNALFVGLARAAGLPARDVYGIRVAPSQWGYRSMSASNNVTRAQHCRAEFYTASHGWVPVDPADVRKVILEEPPGNLPPTHERVKLAREKLFGAWEMNWVAFNYGHDVALPGSKGAPVPFLMYPQAEINGERRDSLDADSFKYTITSKAA
jgi:transglutaminase-like putative cysteine protease